MEKTLDFAENYRNSIHGEPDSSFRIESLDCLQQAYAACGIQIVILNSPAIEFIRAQMNKSEIILGSLSFCFSFHDFRAFCA